MQLLLVCALTLSLGRGGIGGDTRAEQRSENMDSDGLDYITQVMSPSGASAVPLPPSRVGEDSFLDGFAEAGSMPPSVFDGYFEDRGLEAQYAFVAPGTMPARASPGDNSEEGDEEDEEDEEYEEPPPQRNGRATSSSPTRGASGGDDGGDDPDVKHMMKFFMSMMKAAAQGSSEGRSTTLRLAKMPGCGDQLLPSVKDRQQWYDLKF